MHTCCIFLRRLGPSQLQRPPHAITRSMDAIGRVSLTRSLSSNQDLDNSVIITKSCSQVSLECCIPSYVTHNIFHRPLSSLMSLISFISSHLISSEWNTASQRIQALRLKAGKNNLRLRVSVEGGGCSGFKYTFQMEEDPQTVTATATSASEDRWAVLLLSCCIPYSLLCISLMLPVSTPGRLCVCVSVRSLFERDGAAVVVDGDSLQFIRGATVDFQQDLARSSFAVVRHYLPLPVLVLSS